MLQADKIRCSFGSLEILSNLSLKVERDDFVSVVGPNGSGKTTLLRCLVGLLPFSGSISLDGKDIKKCSRKEIARKVGYVPQIVGELPGFSVEQFVSVGRYPHRRSLFGPTPNDQSAIESAMELTQVTKFRGRQLSDLSGGERQRIVLARTLLTNPEFLDTRKSSCFKC